MKTSNNQYNYDVDSADETLGMATGALEGAMSEILCSLEEAIDDEPDNEEYARMMAIYRPAIDLIRQGIDMIDAEQSRRYYAGMKEGA